jgi:hypothetical protein
MIRSMTETDYLQEAKNALLKLCGTEFPDPFLDPFSSEVRRSLVLYPYISGLPDDQLMKSIVAVASKLGDDGFYLSANFKRPADNKYVYHWYVSFDDILNYKEITLPHIMEYILYSPQGIWGIVSSDETHGVLGGSDSFVNEVTHSISEIDNQVLDFLEYWKKFKKDYPEKVNASWMEMLLKNVYGEAQAEQLLRQTNWDEISELNKLFPFLPEHRSA